MTAQPSFRIEIPEWTLIAADWTFERLLGEMHQSEVDDAQISQEPPWYQCAHDLSIFPNMHWSALQGQPSLLQFNSEHYAATEIRMCPMFSDMVCIGDAPFIARFAR